MTELLFDPALIEPIPGTILAGTRARRSFGRLLRGRWIRWGSLRRTRPVSANYGFDRGTPLDRVYIEQFLERHADDVSGDVLEVRDSRYTFLFGGGRVGSVEVVDIDSDNGQATLVADLGSPGSLPAERYDCALVTQTLQYVERPEVALANLRSALKPGGVALVTVPCAARIDPSFESDLWRMTPAGLQQLLSDAGGWSEVDVQGYGNVLASVAFLMGIAAEELRDHEVATVDEDFPLVACARARKAA